MKLPDFIGEHADLYRMTAAALAAGVLVVLFIFTEPVNLRHHNALLNYFSQLQSDEAQLGEAVLQLNFSLSNNYDHATAIIAHMREIARERQEGEAAAGEKPAAAAGKDAAAKPAAAKSAPGKVPEKK